MSTFSERDALELDLAYADRLERALDAFIQADRKMFKIALEGGEVHARAVARSDWSRRLNRLRSVINELRRPSLD